ncbi:hypothetical protein pb186bvf_015276 [Paramecium bursaria]
MIIRILVNNNIVFGQFFIKTNKKIQKTRNVHKLGRLKSFQQIKSINQQVQQYTKERKFSKNPNKYRISKTPIQKTYNQPSLPFQIGKQIKKNQPLILMLYQIKSFSINLIILDIS